MTTNNKVIQRVTPITHPTMMPAGEPSSSLLLCVSAAPVILIDIDVVILLVINVVGLLIDVTEVVGVAVAASLVDFIEIVGVAIAVSLVGTIEGIEATSVASLVVTEVVRLTKVQNKCM